MTIHIDLRVIDPDKISNDSPGNMFGYALALMGKFSPVIKITEFIGTRPMFVDMKKAISLLLIAAYREHPGSQYLLWLLHCDGKGDIPGRIAYRWLMRAYLNELPAAIKLMNDYGVTDHDIRLYMFDREGKMPDKLNLAYCAMINKKHSNRDMELVQPVKAIA